MTDKNVEATEKKPAARARVSRSRSSSGRSHRRKPSQPAGQQGGMNGGEREGSDYRTVVGILNRYCGAKRVTYGDVNMFEFLAWLQNGERTQQQSQKAHAAGR